MGREKKNHVQSSRFKSTASQTLPFPSQVWSSQSMSSFNEYQSADHHHTQMPKRIFQHLVKKALYATKNIFGKLPSPSFVIGVLINCLCFSVVVWQTIICLTKYIERPTGTAVNLKSSKDVSFPAITVCIDYLHRFNWSYLEELCNIRYVLNEN